MNPKDILNNIFPGFCGFACGIAMLILLFRVRKMAAPETGHSAAFY